jgi:hypothetical protein
VKCKRGTGSKAKAKKLLNGKAVAYMTAELWQVRDGRGEAEGGWGEANL